MYHNSRTLQPTGKLHFNQGPSRFNPFHFNQGASF